MDNLTLIMMALLESDRCNVTISSRSSYRCGEKQRFLVNDQKGDQMGFRGGTTYRILLENPPIGGGKNS